MCTHWELFSCLLIMFFSFLTQAQCFTCMDREKCPHLLTIYDPSDTLLFSRDPNQALPNCSAVFSPPSMSCTVCCDQTNVTIYCSVDVGEELEVEASDGSQIENISPVCKYVMNLLNMLFLDICWSKVKHVVVKT